MLEPEFFSSLLTEIRPRCTPAFSGLPSKTSLPVESRMCYCFQVVEGAIQEISVEGCKGASLVLTHEERLQLMRRIIHIHLPLIAGPLLLMICAFENEWAKLGLT